MREGSGVAAFPILRWEIQSKVVVRNIAFRPNVGVATSSAITQDAVGRNRNRIGADVAKVLVGRKKPLVKRPWSKEDLRLLKSMARKQPLAKIAKSLKRTEGATRHKATIEGVSLRMSLKKKTPVKKR
jgi:hypothetical protein